MDLPAVLEKLYPDTPGIGTIDNFISSWPDGVPMPTKAELEQGWQMVLVDRAKRKGAETLQATSEENARKVPGYAKWTEAEMLAWVKTNIDDLLAEVPDIDGLSATVYRNNAQSIDAKWQDVFLKLVVMNKAMARMILALRNKNFPNIVIEE